MFKKLDLPTKPQYVKLSQDLDFFGLFRTMESQFKNCFFFESLYKDEYDSRYSLLGFDPELVISASGKFLQLQGKASMINRIYPKFSQEVSAVNSNEELNLSLEVENPYYALPEIVPQNILSKSSFCGGLVGYMSYEAISYFEPSLNLIQHPDFEQFCFGLYLDGFLYDKMTGETSYFFYEKDRLAQVLDLLRNTSEVENETEISFLGDTLSKPDHQKIVESVIEQIKLGNSFQCEVGFKTKFRIEGDKMAIYTKLREINPSPFMYYLKFHNTVLLGASPELLFRLKDGDMETFPLAGTIGRGKTPEEDRQLARKLLNDPKEKAEHNMLIDLHRNDIGKVAKFGTVKIRRLMDVKKFSHVQHISSEITGVLDSKYDMFDGLAANFPAGTLSGAPKIESIKIIQRNETEPRGPYGGAVGYFGFNGDCMFCIPIRSLFIMENQAFAQTSGGIVYDSKTEDEYQEIIRKLQAMKETLKHFIKK